MIAKTLALVVRALRVDVRDVRSHLFRGALAAIILWFLTTVTAASWMASAPGLQLFRSVVWLNYWFITVAGASYFASAITEEKEERSLSLLKMADIGPVSILLGKWIPRLIGAILLVLVQIPFTSLAVTLGGVLWQQIAAAYVALLAHLFFVGNLGLLASVLFSRTSYATSAMVVLLIGWHIGPFILGETAAGLPGDHWLVFLLRAALDQTGRFFGEMLAWKRLNETMASTFQDGVLTFQVISNLVAGILTGLLAWGIFEPCTRNEVEPLEESPFWSKVRHWGRRGRNRRVWSWPIVWKDFYYVGGGPVSNLIKFCAYFAFMAGITLLFAWDSTWRWKDFGAIFFLWSLFFLVVETALLAARVFRDELQRKTWASLTLLPAPLPEILYAKLAGSLLALLPVIACLTLGALAMREELVKVLSEVLSDPEGVIFFCYFWLQVLLGIHISTYLSIAARWAVWPVAIALGGFLTVMLNMMTFGCIFAMGGPGGGAGEDIAAFLLCLLSGGLIVIFHLGIGFKLGRLAAED